VDAHVHVWEATAFAPDDERGPAGEVERLLATFDAHDVARGIVVQPSVYGADHRYFRAVLAPPQSRLAGVALAEPDDPGGLDALAEVVLEPAVAGIRVPLIRAPDGWIDSAGEAIWRLARASSCVVCAFVQPEQLADLEPWLERFADVPVAIDHLARLDLAGDGRSAALAALTALARYPNVHVKVSALPSLSRESFPHRDVWPEVDATIEEFGPDRVLWGSDYPSILPFGGYDASLGAARLVLADAPRETADAVFGGTALRLFFGGDA
jgi:L-fuconolactonase